MKSLHLKVNNTIILLLLAVSKVTYSQDHVGKLHYGIISADSLFTNGINVVNLGNKKTTVKNSKGEFSILAKANDDLVLSGLNFEEKRIKVDLAFANNRQRNTS